MWIPAKETVEYIQNRIMKWGETNIDHFPWREQIPDYHSLVVEMMLQRTKAEQVVDVFNRFRKEYLGPEDVIKGGLEKLMEILKPLGLSWRAKMIYEMSAVLVKKHRGKVPTDPSELKSLPGVGDYVVAAFLSLHKDIATPILDSNIVRFYGRFFGIEYNNDSRRRKQFRFLAEIMTPKSKTKKFNYALLDFTRKVCNPHPSCNVCPVKRHCHYFKTSNPVP